MTTHKGTSAEAIGTYSRREYLVAGTMGAAAIVAGLTSMRSSLASAGDTQPLDSLIPAEVGRWKLSAQGDARIPMGEQLEDGTYDDVVTRYYTHPSNRIIILLVAYSHAQNGNIQIHRPEACYPAAGYDLSGRDRIELRGGGAVIPALLLTASAPKRTEQILYWSRIGNVFPTSSAGQRWATLRQTLSGTSPDGILVRLSTIDSDRPAALATLKNFAAELLSSGNPRFARLLNGRV